ncbi:ABC transporter substrate-binding protein [Pseudonocardia parietis]|uniref:Peptide/nickel transport system substrate-binding protein n=1 Tax=Pseudonocardia parietis TaxID=570936 RepID=A0ABS4VPM9_9PSEU|nr:ABC transporter substrate-binding protein [Pseudonocardia parietis]MBP2365529.1 peptide/nickel transport system substrate-binding protein [Pseudonocardia parietis]
MPLSRRSFLRATGAAAALAGIPALAACGAPADAATPRLTVAFAGTGPLGTPDPHVVGRPVDRARAAAVADTLLGWGQDMRPEPHLAASVGPDRTGTRWRIRLREAIAHDGRPLTSADVLASWRRILAPATGATAAPLLTHVDLTASRAISATELEIVLTTPDFLFPLVLGAPGTGIVRDGRGDAPIGTGAFLTTGDDPAVLTRHDAHWLGAAPSRELEFLVDDDEENRYQSLLDGHVAYAHDLFPHSVRRLLGRAGTTVVSAPGSATRFLEPTGAAPDGDVLADPRLLEAVRLGIDRDELVRTVLLDLGEPGDDLFGPGLAHHPADVPPVVRDVGRARELVVAAGAGSTAVPLQFDPFDPLSRPAATVLTEQLEAIGLRVEPREPDAPDADPSPGLRFRRVPAHPIPLHLRAAALARADASEPAVTGAAFPRPADLAPLLATAARTPDERVRDDALHRAQLLLRDTATAWSVGDEHIGISADLTGVEPARPDTGTWARFHRVRWG